MAALSPAFSVFASGLKDTVWDVIVIGSGAAGLTAAASSKEAGARNVLLLEKAPSLGGHTIVSTGYVSAVDPPRQKTQGIVDSPELMLANMLDIGGGKNDIELARVVCENSQSAIEWLESIGVKWEPEVTQTVAGVFPRSHRSNRIRAGYDYILALNRYARKLGVSIKLRTRAKELIERYGKVEGVVVEDSSGCVYPIRSKAVVIATGGFTANTDLRQQYDSRLTSDLPTTANPSGLAFDGATGDGLIMASNIGAAKRDVQFIQLIPFLGGRLLDYVGGDIFINNRGERFVSESAQWKEISDAVLALPDKTMWAITDSQSKKGASLGIKLMNKVVMKADTVREMANVIGVDPIKLQKTLDLYNDYALSGIDLQFGKNVFSQLINTPPYYFGKEKLGVHFCCGGIYFNKRAQVIKENLEPIEGLFVAEEAGGGPHGHDRMGGVSLTTAFVFGRIAGKEAAKF